MDPATSTIQLHSHCGIPTSMIFDLLRISKQIGSWIRTEPQLFTLNGQFYMSKQTFPPIQYRLPWPAWPFVSSPRAAHHHHTVTSINRSLQSTRALLARASRIQSARSMSKHGIYRPRTSNEISLMHCLTWWTSRQWTFFGRTSLSSLTWMLSSTKIILFPEELPGSLQFIIARSIRYGMKWNYERENA